MPAGIDTLPAGILFTGTKITKNNNESALKTGFCHFERSEKSYIINKNNGFLVALLRGGKMTVIDLFRLNSISHS